MGTASTILILISVSIAIAVTGWAMIWCYRKSRRRYAGRKERHVPDQREQSLEPHTPVVADEPEAIDEATSGDAATEPVPSSEDNVGLVSNKVLTTEGEEATQQPSDESPDLPEERKTASHEIPLPTEPTQGVPEQEFERSADDLAAEEQDTSSLVGDSDEAGKATKPDVVKLTEKAAVGDSGKDVFRRVRKPSKPENRGGRPRETTPNHGEILRKRVPRTPKPEIVCWKREREWLVAVEIPEDFSESQFVTVLQDGKPLDKDETDERCWLLSQIGGEVVVHVAEVEDETSFSISLGAVQWLAFKLYGSDLDRGRRIKPVSYGSYLVIVPATWERDDEKAGAPPTTPEHVCLDGYQAHFFDLLDGAVVGIAFRNDRCGEILISSGGPRFQLVGNELHDASDNIGPLFVSTPPLIRLADGSWESVGTIVLGEEGKGGGRWHMAFEPDSAVAEQEMPNELLAKRVGWYFIRFYNLEAELIDSLDFRFAAGLRGITGGVCQPLTTGMGHEVVTVEFEHDADWCVCPSLAMSEKLEVTHAAEKTTVRILPMQEFDQTEWLIGPRDAAHVKVVFQIERVWWAFGDVNKQPQQWHDTCLFLSIADFTATSESAVWLHLPKRRWADRVLVGFQPDKRREYPLKVSERTLAIPLRDLSDAPELAERTHDCALQVWATHSGNTHETVVAVVPADAEEKMLDIASIPACHLATTLTILHAEARGPLRQFFKVVRRRYRRPSNAAVGHNVEFVKESLCAIAVLLHLADNQQYRAPKVADRWKSKACSAEREFPDTMRQLWKRYRKLEGRGTGI